MVCSGAQREVPLLTSLVTAMVRNPSARPS